MRMLERDTRRYAGRAPPCRARHRASGRCRRCCGVALSDVVNCFRGPARSVGIEARVGHEAAAGNAGAAARPSRAPSADDSGRWSRAAFPRWLRGTSKLRETFLIERETFLIRVTMAGLVPGRRCLRAANEGAGTTGQWPEFHGYRPRYSGGDAAFTALALRSKNSAWLAIAERCWAGTALRSGTPAPAARRSGSARGTP